MCVCVCVCVCVCERERERERGRDKINAYGIFVLKLETWRKKTTVDIVLSWRIILKLKLKIFW